MTVYNVNILLLLLRYANFNTPDSKYGVHCTIFSFLSHGAFFLHVYYLVYISDELHFTLGSVSFIFLLATMHNSYDIVYLELKRWHMIDCWKWNRVFLHCFSLVFTKTLWNDSAFKIRKYKKEDDVNHNYVSSVENRKINLLITTT